MEAAAHLSAADLALVSTIYNPPRARQPWVLKEILPEGATRYYSLARWALVDALRACGVGPGDRVLVPGLICREVLASINLLDATPVFYPVSPELRAGFSHGDLGQAKAVLAVNYFGFPQGLEMFRQYCERTGAALIEDNAHGLLSRDENGQLLGSRGDAGIFSFRKTVALPGGGALVLGGGRSMPPRPDLPFARTVVGRYRLKQACRRVADRLGPIRSARSIGAVRQLRQLLSGNGFAASAPDTETRIRAAPNPPALIRRGVAVADPELESERRRALYGLAGRILEAIAGIPVFPHLPQNAVPYGFPFFAAPAHVPGIATHLARHGMLISRWPDLPAAVAPSAPEHYRHLLVVPFLW